MDFNNTKAGDVDYILKQLEKNINVFIEKQKLEKNYIKANFTISINFSKTRDNEEIFQTAHFRTPPTIISPHTNLILQDIIDIINLKIDKFQKEGSGWRMENISNVRVDCAKYDVIRGSSYIHTPKHISDKKAIINIQNDDDFCFLWSIIAHFYPASHNPHRVSNYVQYVDKFNIKNISFPISIHDVTKFEKLNNIGITIILYDNNKFLPYYVPSQNTYNYHVNLLLIYNEVTHHYCLIKNLARLLSAEVTTNHRTLHFCVRCLSHFTTKELLKKHILLCENKDISYIKMPTPTQYEDVPLMKFRNIQYMLRAPFTIYCDFESFLIPETGDVINRHEIASYCYFVVSDHPKYIPTKPEYYRGPNVINHLLDSLSKLETLFVNLIEDIIPLDKNVDVVNLKKNATHCSICGIGFFPTNDDKFVKDVDHDHLTGEFRGIAHKNCNLRYNIKPKSFKIPIFFHNGEHYDFHLLITTLGEYINKNQQKIRILPHNTENYMSIHWGNHYVFKDSFHFLSSSLASLTDNLADKGSENFTHLNMYYKENACHLLQKGYFPYRWFDSIEKFEYTELPAREHFDNSLNNEKISDDDFNYIKKIWNIFNMKTFGEYHDLYLITDVLLLTDIFENFRKTCVQKFNLDPAHYVTLPSFSWDAMLKTTKVRIELLQDVDMYLFFEMGCRGGISTITHRFSKANNKYLSNYNPFKPTKYIQYLDKNSLYPEAMLEPLPFANFKWVYSSKFTEEYINKLNIYDFTGYILEVDLEYPKELHTSHSDYPLAVEKIQINKDMLSPYNKTLHNTLNNNHVKIKKLLPNFYKKENYIVHYRNLKYYLSKGLKLTKVHRVISFNQSTWMSSYINLCVNERKIATSSFEKDLWKLFMNATFGKSMENVRKRVNFELKTDEHLCLKAIAKPSYKRCIKFSEYLIGVESRVLSVNLNKPIFVGQSILDISKLNMAIYHYDHIKKIYPNEQSKLLFTDTDSFCYEIYTDDVYTDMMKYNELYDFSNFNINHPCIPNNFNININNKKNR